MKQLILASASPRRKQLLEMLGLRFTIVPSFIDEKLSAGLTPLQQVETLSKQKAEAVGSQFDNALILAADTMVAVGSEVIGKPRDEQDAIRILKKISGKSHAIVTGFTLYDTQTKKMITKSTETKIWFREMTDKEIRTFVKKEKPFDKAGAYAIHELASVFIEKLEGDHMAPVGLSVFQLAKSLKEFGFEVL